MYDISEYVYICGFDQLERRGKDYHFRCPICGDSKKSRTKKRGWIKWNQKYDTWMYKCYNNCVSMSFMNYLKEYEYDAYKDFIKAKYKNEYTKKEPVKKEVEPEVVKYESVDLPKIISMSGHEVYKYCQKRLIPFKFYNYFFYAENYTEWINTKIPNKFSYVPDSDPRLVLPFYNADKKLFGVAGRSLDPKNKLRYITIRFNEKEPKIFGLDRINTSKKHIYVFEGQLDSVFIPNSVAMSGGELSTKHLTDIADKDKFVFIYDNEVNHQIFNTIEKVIREGFKVCFLPKSMRKYGKDINDYIKEGFTRRELFDIINKNIYSGLRARAFLAQWRRL